VKGKKTKRQVPKSHLAAGIVPAEHESAAPESSSSSSYNQISIVVLDIYF
jgi:hypothetical protein